MAGLERAFLYVGVPGIAVVASLLWVRSYAADPQRERAPDAARGPSRFVVFVGIQATAVVFGLVLLMIDLGLSGDLDMAPAVSAEPLRRLLLWAAIAFAWTAAVMLGCEAWVARRRWRDYEGSGFGRVQPLLVVPEVGMIFALILSFLLFGAIRTALDTGISFSPTAVQETIFGSSSSA